MAQTPLYFYIGKEPALAYATGVPFGMNHRHQESWWSKELLFYTQIAENFYDNYLLSKMRKG